MRKMYQPKKSNISINQKECKYPTRKQTKQLENNDSDESKRNKLRQKISEKELPKKMPTMGSTGMPQMVMPGLSGMPFQMINAQNPTGQPMMGVFPAMTGQK